MQGNISIIIPDHVYIGKKKFYLNMNIYRNAHYQVLNKAKIEFKKMMYPALPIGLNLNKIKVHYTVYYSDKRRFDLMNVVSVVDKFLMDALVEYEIIHDDNYTIVDYGSIESYYSEISKEKYIIANIIY